MNLTISDDQRDLLTSILQDSLGELREEIYKAEVGQYRDELHKKEELLRGLLAVLGSPAPGS